MTTDPKLFKIADTLANLTVLEAKELVRILETEYGILPNIPAFNNGAISVEEVEEVEQTEFDVYLKEIGGQKLQVIKKAKELFNLTLLGAKDLVESAPVKIKESVSKEVAENIKSELESFGALIEIK
jgi:large subunit ribosomal protein L7/L12